MNLTTTHNQSILIDINLNFIGVNITLFQIFDVLTYSIHLFIYHLNHPLYIILIILLYIIFTSPLLHLICSSMFPLYCFVFSYLWLFHLLLNCARNHPSRKSKQTTNFSNRELFTTSLPHTVSPSWFISTALRSGTSYCTSQTNQHNLTFQTLPTFVYTIPPHSLQHGVPYYPRHRVPHSFPTTSHIRFISYNHTIP